MNPPIASELICLAVGSKFRLGLEIGDTVLVEAHRVGFGGRGRSNERQEEFVRKGGECRCLFLFSITDFASCKRSFMSRLHLLGESFVRLLCALADRFSIPGELVPPVLRAFLFVDSHMKYSSAI